MNEIEFRLRVVMCEENEAVAEERLLDALDDFPGEVHIESSKTLSGAFPRKDAKNG